MTYTNKRTGNTWATQAMSIAMDGDDSAAAAGVGVGVKTAPIAITGFNRAGDIVVAEDTRARDKYGNLITTQTGGSQYYLDVGYTGKQPGYEEYLYTSDAQRAYDKIQQTAIAAVKKNAFVNPVVAALAAAPVSQQYTPTGTTSANLPDLAAFADPAIKWLERNFLYVALILGALILLPSLISVLKPGRA